MRRARAQAPAAVREDADGEDEFDSETAVTPTTEVVADAAAADEGELVADADAGFAPADVAAADPVDAVETVVMSPADQAALRMAGGDDGLVVQDAASSGEPGEAAAPAVQGGAAALAVGAVDAGAAVAAEPDGVASPSAHVAPAVDSVAVAPDTAAPTPALSSFADDDRTIRFDEAATMSVPAGLVSGGTTTASARSASQAAGATPAPAATPQWDTSPWEVSGAPSPAEPVASAAATTVVPPAVSPVAAASPWDTPASPQSETAVDRTVVRPQTWTGSRDAANGHNARENRAARRAARRKQQAATPAAAGYVPAASRAASSGSGAGAGTGTGPSAGSRGSRRSRAPKRAKHGCLSFFLWIIMLGVLALMAARCLPASYASGRAIPELVSFVPLLFIPIIVCLVLSAWWRRRLLLVVCVLALGVMGWWHRGYFLPTARVSATAQAAVAAAATTDDNAARIMTLNTLNGSASAQEVVQTCRDQHVEILCLQELTSSFIDELYAAGIGDVLPYSVVSAEASSVSNGGRNGIWTLAPMSNISYNLLPIETSSMPAGTIQIGSRSLRIVSVHPNSPVRGAQDLWEEGLSVIGSLSGYDHSYVIMGDFNSTWDHARFRELLGSSFVDAGEQAGEGFHMTYPSSGHIPSLVEIDHIVYARDSGIVVSDLETVAVTGSDHQALLATLEAV